MVRFNFNADTVEEAAAYLAKRGKQVLMDGWKIEEIHPVVDGSLVVGAYAKLIPNEYHRIGCWEKNKVAYSIYILKSHRNKGHFERFYYEKLEGAPIITTPDCEITEFLIKKNIPFFLRGTYQNHSDAYKMIQEAYRDRCAARSGIELMNHIDEGLAILTHFYSQPPHLPSYDMLDAWCVHPIFQENISTVDSEKLKKLSQLTVMLATEYRHVANGYLSKHHKADNNEDNIQLSDIKDVNKMLVADKLQNYKDFKIHRNKYVNAYVLESYFKAWIIKLDVFPCHSHISGMING